MKVRDVLLVAFLVVSLGANAWLVNQRLEGLYYAKGVADGKEALAAQVVNQVQQKGTLNITLPSGQQIPMIVQQAAAQGPGLGQILGGMGTGRAIAAAVDPNAGK